MTRSGKRHCTQNRDAGRLLRWLPHGRNRPPSQPFLDRFSDERLHRFPRLRRSDAQRLILRFRQADSNRLERLVSHGVRAGSEGPQVGGDGLDDDVVQISVLGAHDLVQFGAQLRIDDDVDGDVRALRRAHRLGHALPFAAANEFTPAGTDFGVRFTMTPYPSDLTSAATCATASAKALLHRTMRPTSFPRCDTDDGMACDTLARRDKFAQSLDLTHRLRSWAVT